MKRIESIYRRGFTLIEMLTVLTIIGFLSSVGYVSYESAKVSARDTKRVSDMKQIQTALELYFETHSSYPSDGTPGDDGQLIGFVETKILSDVGFSAEQHGVIYMQGVPKNPQPGGTEYVYRSLYNHGANCHIAAACETYAILFTLEGNSGSLGPGPHALTPSGITGEGGAEAGRGVLGAGGFVIGLRSSQELVSRYALDAAQLVVEVADNKQLEQIADFAAPTATLFVLTNTVLTAQATTSATALLFYLFAQPLLIFSRRKRRAWGVIYNSFTKLPVDLAIVRLIDTQISQRVKSTVTDRGGRFSFLVTEGSYLIEVAKAGFIYPSQYVVGVSEDGQYTNVYTGGEIKTPQGGGLLIPNIPIDPVIEEETDRIIIRRNYRKYLQRGVAVLGPTIGLVCFVISPNILTGILLIAQLGAYWLFKRLAITKEPKQWGYVYEQGVGRAVANAVLRIFALPYHKLAETQVSDRRGRYHFRVGSGLFYLTATRTGYEKTESEPLDLKDHQEPTVIASNIPLAKSEGSLPEDSRSVTQRQRSTLINSQPTVAQIGEKPVQSPTKESNSLDDLLPLDEGAGHK
ncbi:prepilin-type N-terminal cleavage/methylation domain-containing protein [Patescibacteria group bacterium]|nr:prepilin-type N-terminal cleavage/methylation domain-containing protein [Patescibacteria group bacterium]MBU1029408.1 prepilin-type N-terminal cleavage/methylation domain-containing protein [Patescibacteria group bacterium]MBU1915516.1 prepilin-type N-terminal cleavage/methylation domain-containing protein [Patescibacteria group bacterium]